MKNKVVPIKTDRFAKLLSVLIATVIAFVAILFIRTSMHALDANEMELLSLIGGLLFMALVSLLFLMSSKHQ